MSVLGLAVALALLAVAPAARAATKGSKASPEIALPEPLTKEAVRELVARLSDDEVRRLLLAQLDRAAVAAPPGPEGMGAMLSAAETQAGQVRARVLAALGAVPRLPSVVPFAVRRLNEGRTEHHVLLVAALLAGMLTLAWGVERGFRRLLRGTRARLEQAAPPSVAAQAGHLVLRLVLEALALVVFAGVVVLGFLALSQGHEPSRQLAITGLAIAVFIKLAAALSRFVLAPRAPHLRLLPVDDPAARRLHRGAVGFASVAAGTLLGIALLQRLGLDPDLVLVLRLLGRTLGIAILLGLVWQNRRSVADLIRGNGASALRRIAADLWPVLATAYLVGVAGLITLEELAGRAMLAGAGLASILVVLAMPLADRALCALVTGGPAEAPDAAPAGRAVFAPVLRRGIHILVTVAGLLFLARLWRVDVRGMAAGSVGEWATAALIDVAVTLLLAVLAWEVVRTLIDRKIQAEDGPRGGELGEEGGQGASRLRTLLPVLRMGAFGTVLVLAGMLVLSALGVNIGPLLAGAGVVGLAIGFGSQTLVRDIVSGAFFLADDAFRLGEYIQAAGIKGTVEKIGVRSMQVRHHRGALHTLPYGQIQRLTNDSRDWIIMKLEFRLTYDTDLIKVKRILKKIGEELSADPEMGPNLIQPLKSQGVMATEDSALVVRAKFMAKPGSAPYLIQREAYTRILRAFKEQGIQFAHRQVTVFTAGNGEAARAAAAGAAARALVEEEEAAPTEKGP